MITQKTRTVFSLVFIFILAGIFTYPAPGHHTHDHAVMGKCSQNVQTQWFYQQHPGARPENNPAHQELATFTRNFIRMRNLENAGLAGTEAETVLTIPIVFHIIHQNGPENISDTQVMSALQALNED